MKKGEEEGDRERRGEGGDGGGGGDGEDEVAESVGFYEGWEGKGHGVAGGGEVGDDFFFAAAEVVEGGSFGLDLFRFKGRGGAAGSCSVLFYFLSKVAFVCFGMRLKTG